MLCSRCKASVDAEDRYCSRCGNLLHPGANRRVVVTGVGAVTPLGNTAEETWQGLCDGRSGITKIERFDPSELTVQIAGEVREFDMGGIVDRKTERGMALFSKFGVASAGMAMKDACLDPTSLDPDRAGVVVGTGAGGMATILETQEVALRRGLMRVSPHFMTTFPHNLPAYHIHQLFGFFGPSLTVSTACATGAQAIGEAAQFIRSGQADVMVAGGTEHCIFPLFVASFAVQRAASTMNDAPEKASMPFDANRHGFVLGEGAAMVVLETLENARNRGATVYAEVLGYGASDDGYHPIAPEPEGRGAAYAMNLALQEGGINPAQVDYVNAHAASTPLGDKAETLAIKKSLGKRAYEVAISSSKSMIGHLMGAAGAVEAMATILTIRDQVVHPTINYVTPDPECDLDYVPNTGRELDVNVALSNSIGLGGQNTCLAFGRIQD
ncbi:MAG: beta-ketoacyl-[acyl-carrier-protein] synthase II [Sphaerobacteraceae bacterium]|nr:MAG: beta-ketoacyl-[acyl-carrier-protein] synthase II [Sphaerobacteraceae bacterium]